MCGRRVGQAQRHVEMLLGARGLAEHQQRLAESGVDDRLVRIERQRVLVAPARTGEVALLEADVAQADHDVDAVRRQLVRAQHQRLALVVGAELAAQDAVHVERLDVVRVLGQPEAISLVGLGVAARAVQFDRLLQHELGNPARKDGDYAAARRPAPDARAGRSAAWRAAVPKPPSRSTLPLRPPSSSP